MSTARYAVLYSAPSAFADAVPVVVKVNQFGVALDGKRAGRVVGQFALGNFTTRDDAERHAAWLALGGGG